MLSFMVDTFSESELATWAVLDVHLYYAWDSTHAGCMVRTHLALWSPVLTYMILLVTV